MKKNYFLGLFGLIFSVALYPQSSGETFKDSIKGLSKSFNKAYENYDYNSAIEHGLELIRLASKKQDDYHLSNGYNNLGIVWEVLEDSSRAKENYQKSLEYAQLLKNDTLLLNAYNNLGNIYSQDKKTVAKGIQFYQKALKIASTKLSPKEALTPVINIGWTYLENKDYDKALPYLLEAEEFLQDLDEPSARANLLVLFGMYHTGKNDFEAARQNFERSAEIVDGDSLYRDASFTYEEFAKMLFKNGNFQEAYAALEKHQELREKVQQQERNLQREAMYGKFETEFETEEYKKDLAAAQREQQYKDEALAKTKQLSLITSVSAIVMFIFLVLLFKNNRIRKRLISQLKDKNRELIASKEEAERLSMLKTRFFSTVSHELRTPLYGVVGLTDLLLEDNQNEKQREDLKSLKFSADYLLALINDVLQMNKMESNLVHLENSNFNIKELFEGIVKSFETTRNLNENKIELQIDDDIPQVLIGDSMRLSQIMMNLMGNAVKFTENGLVWIKAELRECPSHECYIHFEVGDTGVGIPQDKQQEIFEEFSQLKSNNFNYQGTGLGLPIVKKLLHLFKSEIRLDSEVGKGSVFSFEIGFERGQSHETVASNTAAMEAETAALVKRALIVDDNRINQVVTQRILEKKDFECAVAGSGEEAIEILQKEHFDLVLMDVNMPGMNGMQTTQEIRKFNANIPVIALTAVEVGEMREEILGAGMNDIINKPYDIPQFFNTIFRNLLQPVA
ncbi:MAG: response regulator [Salinimicrobium sp.]